MKRFLSVLFLLVLCAARCPARAGEDFLSLTGLDGVRTKLEEGILLEEVFYTDGAGIAGGGFSTADPEEMGLLLEALCHIRLGEKTNEDVTDLYPLIRFSLSDGSSLGIRFDGHWLEPPSGDHYRLTEDAPFWALTAALTEKYGQEARTPGAAIRVGETEISFDELKARIRLELFLGALRCAGFGYGLDITDPLVIEDKTDKTVFSMEEEVVMRRLAAERGVFLEEEDLERARTLARERWEECRSVVYSENGMAFLPAGEYVPAEDPEETVRRYFASFGLTQEELYREARDRILDEKLRADYTAGMEGTEEDLLLAYVDWELAQMDAAGITEDPEALTRVIHTLWED